MEHYILIILAGMYLPAVSILAVTKIVIVIFVICLLKSIKLVSYCNRLMISSNTIGD